MTDNDCLWSSSSNETQNIEGKDKDTFAQSLKSAAISQQTQHTVYSHTLWQDCLRVHSSAPPGDIVAQAL